MASKNCTCTVLFFRNFICFLAAFMKGPKSGRVMNRVVLNAFFYHICIKIRRVKYFL